MTIDNLSRTLLYVCLVISILDVLAISATAANRTRIRSRRQTRRQNNRCNGFRCTTNGECIDEENRCDGIVHCRDGSDEFNDCKQAATCPGYLFTCDYGACIEAEKKCNGEKDCRDNSDEANCIETPNFLAEQLGGNCKSDQFECKSGECISSDDKCNGVPDCKDKSDETKEACLNIQCPGFTFKCDYGACVNGYAECDGNKDCIDNSDEQNKNCGAPTPSPIPTPTPSSRPPTQGGVCKLPEIPQNGQWSLLGGSTSVKPGQKVALSTVIQFTCNPGYVLSRENQFLACVGNAVGDGWNMDLPKCAKLCPALYTDEITRVHCYNEQKIEIKCDQASDGAYVTFECAPYYEPTDRAAQKRYCFGGSWNYPPPKCVPVCGEKKVSAEPLIVNGVNVERGDYPWVTAIYYKLGEGFQNICGGSMITQRVILTAAHCVTDDYGHAQNSNMYKAAVGKYYNKYLDTRDTEAQYTDLQQIIVHEKYRGDSQRFASDIALLITKDKLLLSKVVQPICYNDLPHLHLSLTSVGVVTGWGFTLSSGSPSDELKEVTVPYKDDAECSKELPQEWLDKYFTYDKFCAGHFNKSIAVCKGDSGGGLGFKHTDGRYYVYGIVSLAKKVEKDTGCDIQLSALYTNVQKHFEWLEQKTAAYSRTNDV